jgi:hypothetical protein
MCGRRVEAVEDDQLPVRRDARRLEIAGVRGKLPEYRHVLSPEIACRDRGVLNLVAKCGMPDSAPLVREHDLATVGSERWTAVIGADGRRMR